METSRILIATGAAILFAAGASARPDDDFTFPRPANGKVVERTHKPGVWRATVWLTDKAGKDIDGVNWPKDGIFTRSSKAEFDVPQKVQKKGTGQKDENGNIIPPVFIDVIDVHQKLEEVKTDPSLAAVSDLHIEAIYRSDMGEYGLGNVFGCLAERVGWFKEVRVPDLFADTNGDGELGMGDELFAVADLNVMLDQPYPYQLGDTFMIINGMAFGAHGPVMGMVFSSQPFTFSAAGGFGSAGLFTGEGVADGEHGVSPVPAPGAGALVGARLLTLRRRRS